MDENNYNPPNCICNNIKHIKYLTGPYTLSIMSDNNCTLMNIGDIHIATDNGFNCNKYQSTYLPEYMKYLFKKYPNKELMLW